MSTYRIYADDIDNADYEDGAEGYPVGTAAKLADALRAEFPEMFVEVVKNVTGYGSGYHDDDYSPASDNDYYLVTGFVDEFMQNVRE